MIVLFLGRWECYPELVKAPGKPTTESLVFSFSQIRNEGSFVRFQESFSDLYRKGEASLLSDEMRVSFTEPVSGELSVFRVGSKAHVKGRFETLVTGDCDRCGEPLQLPMKANFEYFLVPENDDEGHWDDVGEDSYFSHFDGERLDLRPLLREALILELPMRFVLLDESGACQVCPKASTAEPEPGSL